MNVQNSVTVITQASLLDEASESVQWKSFTVSHVAYPLNPQLPNESMIAMDERALSGTLDVVQTLFFEKAKELIENCGFDSLEESDPPKNFDDGPKVFDYSNTVEIDGKTVRISTYFFVSETNVLAEISEQSKRLDEFDQKLMEGAFQLEEVIDRGEERLQEKIKRLEELNKTILKLKIVVQGLSKLFELLVEKIEGD